MLTSGRALAQHTPELKSLTIADVNYCGPSEPNLRFLRASALASSRVPAKEPRAGSFTCTS